MQKVYLLLRNNQQTGPYNLQELLQFDLKPYDLIWIEGKSAGWYYPQEIKALQQHLSFLKQPPAQTMVNTILPPPAKTLQPTQSKTVFVSMPSFTREESITKPSFAAVAASEVERPKFSEPVPKTRVDEVKTSNLKSIKEAEPDYMNLMYDKKKTKKPVVSVKGAIAACLVIGIAIAAWWIMKPMEESKIDSAEQSSIVPAQNELPADSLTLNESSTEYTKSASPKKQRQDNPVANKKPAGIVAKQTPRHQTETTVTTKTTESNEYELTPPVVKEEAEPVVKKKDEPVIAEAPKENKKLREKIVDLFKKKPEEKKEEVKPAEEDDGRRNSTRRESGSSLAQMVTVKLSTPNDWMMGIKGAKATLTNRSSEAVVKSTVEIIYYNDDNDVVDRKTIFFAGIKGKQSQTISIPDHATATRLEYNVVSATGAGEPFAKM